MTQTNSLFPKPDPITERRKVLAKVYRLLLRLADEVEKNTPPPDLAVAVEEKVKEPVLIAEGSLSQ